jgi:hypothetical protein
LTDTVATLEDGQSKIRETLGSTRHHLLETNENYVKDKDQLSQAKSSISEQHQAASVSIDWTIQKRNILFIRQTTSNGLDSTVNHMTTQTIYMKKHIIEMNESRLMMETLTVKIRGEIQTAE